MKNRLLSMLAIALTTTTINAQVTNYQEGDVVNDFTVTDIDGNSHTFSAIANSGKWLLIYAFTDDAQICQEKAPFISELNEKYGCNAGDIYVLFMNANDDNATVQSFMDTYASQGGFSTPPAVSGVNGGSNSVLLDMGIDEFPTTALFDTDRTLQLVDIWPFFSIADIESAMADRGFTPTPMTCSTGIEEEQSVFSNLGIFPNPASESTSISVNLEASTEVTVELYNNLGSVVSTNSYAGESGANNFALNTSELENGRYILRVNFGEALSTTRQLSILK